MTLKVLQIVADGSRGGGTTHVLQILRGLSNVCSFKLVAQRGSSLLNEAGDLGIPCADADFFSSRLDARVPLKLRHIVREFEPQVVHVHGGRAGFFHTLAATRKPTVYTVHGYHFVHKHPLFRWFAVRAERLVASSARNVILVANYDAAVARTYKLLTDPNKSVVIHNGIPVKKISRAKPKETKHVGFVGRLEYQKDPLLFLKVMERLPGYTATIVGGGKLEDKVKAVIKHRGLSQIHVLGSLSHPETLQVLSTFDALVMTSRWEGLPILPLEAMWSGVPVVAMNVGGISEIIESGKSGLLVDNRSADELARAVVRLAEDVALRECIVKEGRNRVREAFSEEQMLRKTFEVYRRVAQ
jgi:glycosyltransferase involved in cell wall biosynthesis